MITRYWIVIILKILCQQIQYTITEDINNKHMTNDTFPTVSVIFPGGVYQMNISWNSENQPDIVQIETHNPNDKCKELGDCSKHEISMSTRSINLPLDEHLDYGSSLEPCIFLENCSYNVQLLDNEKKTIWSKITEIEACIKDGGCLCKEKSHFPKFNLTAENFSANSVNIYWSFDMKNSKLPTYSKLEYINVSLYDKDSKFPNSTSATSQFPLNITINNRTTTVQNGFKELNISKGELQENHIYSIRAFLIDDKHCEGDKNVNTVKSRLKPTDDRKAVMLALTIVILILIAICITPYIQRKIYDLLPFCQRRYRNISPRSIRPAMENNILYTDIESILANADDKYEINPNKIHINKRIGIGNFGIVFEGTLTYFNKSSKIAIKQPKHDGCSEEIISDFLSEIDIMKNVGKHEHIVKLIGCCTKTPPLMMVMEYVGGGSLLEYLHKIRSNICGTNSSKVIRSPQAKYIDLMLSSSNCTTSSDKSYISVPQTVPSTTILRPSVTDTVYTTLSYDDDNNTNYIFDNNELRNFAIQIAKGMRYLEEISITHRDLAARNILIEMDRKILKISDFGLSRNGNYVTLTPRRLPLRWLSIEAIRDNIYSSKSDVWAFGVVLWEIGNLGAQVYGMVPDNEILSYLMSGKRLEKPAICSDELYDLMIDCWCEQSKDRPSFEDILKILQPEYKKLYVDLSDISSDYVFPPINLHGN